MALKLRVGVSNMPQSGHTLYVYETGTTNLVEPLFTPDSISATLSNPFTVPSSGWYGFEPPNNKRVDVYWTEGNRYLVEDINCRDFSLELDDTVSPTIGESLTWDGTKWTYVNGVADHEALENPHPQYTEKTGTTGSTILPVGTSTERDVSPGAGYVRFNTEEEIFEGFNGTKWGTLGGGIKENDVDDVPVDGATVSPISSNWAYDHVNANDPHPSYALESDLGTAAAMDSTAFDAAGAAAGAVTGHETAYDHTSYLTSETDPVFSAWDKSTGISITKSQISDIADIEVQVYEPGDIRSTLLGLYPPKWILCNGGVIDAANYPTLSSLNILPRPISKLGNPADLPSGTGRGVSFSPDGVYMAVAHVTSPFITIYKRSGDVFTKLGNPSDLPAGTGFGVSFSPDGVYMAVGHVTSPFITIYKRSGDVFTKLGNPSDLPYGTGRGVSFSPDGVYMAVAHDTSPFITIYKRSGDVFTKLGNPSDLPYGTGLGVSFSPDGVYMAVAHGTSPFITIYKRSGDVFTKLGNPAALPSDAGYGVSFSPDGVYMAVAHDTSPFITIYKRSGDVFTKLGNPAALPSDAGFGVSFSPDGVYMAVAHGTSPFITIYKRSGDVFTKLGNPAALPSDAGFGVSFSPDGVYMAVAHFTPPFITIYGFGQELLVPLPSTDQFLEYIYTGEEAV